VVRTPDRLETAGPPRTAMPMSAALRLLAAGIVAVLLALAVTGIAADLPALRAVAVSLFLLTGLGVAPALLARPVTVSSFVLLALTLSLAATTTVGFVMAQAGSWAPLLAFVACVAITCPLLAAAVIRDLGELRTAWSRLRGRAGISRPGAAQLRLNLVALVGVLVVAVAAFLQQSAPERAGLYLRLGPGWYLGLLILLGCVLWARVANLSPALPVTALGTAVVLSQAIVYGGPTVMSAARHVGIVEYIRTHGGLESGLDIYQAWAGLFAGTAWLCDAADIQDPMTIATWWPVLMSAALALAVRELAGRFLAGTFAAWTVAAVFILANTLNITYYSPQSLGFFLALVVYVLALARNDRSATGRRARLGLIVYLACVLAVTHQISPYLLALGLAVLVTFGLVRPWWVPLVVALPAVGWAVVNSAVLGPFIRLDALGRVGQNVTPPAHPTASAGIEPVTRLAFQVPAAVLVLVGLAALVTVLRRPSRTTWGLLVAAGSSGVLTVVSNYGQEGIFRVAMFALPWLALLAVYPGRGALRISPTVIAGGLAVLILVNAFGQTALDWGRVVRPDTSDATRWFERSATKDAVMLVTGTSNATPGKVTERYGEVRYVGRDTLEDFPDVSERYDPAADVRHLTGSLVSRAEASEYYALVSDSLGGYDDLYGLQDYADYVRFRSEMARSPLWEEVRVGATSRLYRLRNPDGIRRDFSETGSESSERGGQ